MRFGLVHRIMTDALAALGIFAVVSTQATSFWTNVVLLVGLAAAIALPERWQGRRELRAVGPVGSILLAVFEAVRLMTGESMLDVAVEFTALIQVLRLLTRKGAAHDQQIIVLALLHLVAGTVLGGGIAYALCFLGFIVVAPGALVLSHLRREVEGNYRQGARDRTGLPVDVPRILRSRRVVGRGFLASTCLISVPIFLFTAGLFVLFPRVGLSLLLLNHPRAGRMVGFSDHVDLGEVGVLRSDPSIALRFETDSGGDPPPSRLTLRLRGTAFDAYDGRAWSRTQSDRRPAERSAFWNDTYPITRVPDPARDRSMAIEVEPIDPPVLFLPPRAIAVQLKPQSQSLLGEALSLQRGPEGEFRYAGEGSRGLRYEVYLAKEREVLADVLPSGDRGRYLQVPPLPSRIALLAHEWADPEPTDALKAHVIEERLRTLYKYDIASPSGGTKQPLDHFLFESKRGHCEFFSSAMAIMLRAVGIPSRNVTGFVGGTYNRFGHYYAVREGDAHSWVEAYLEETPREGLSARGAWVTFDPTPASGAQPLEETTGTLVYVRDFVEALSQRWNRYVVGYDLRTQVHLFEDMRRRYETARAATGLNRGLVGKLTRGPVVLGGVLLLGAAAYLVWRRRRRGEKVARRPGPETDRRFASAAALYRGLEAVLAEKGVARARGTPPLRHAELLVAESHPLASEIHELTGLYLEVRFGGRELSDELRRDYEGRVKRMRLVAPTP